MHIYNIVIYIFNLWLNLCMKYFMLYNLKVTYVIINIIITVIGFYNSMSTFKQVGLIYISCVISLKKKYFTKSL